MGMYDELLVPKSYLRGLLKKEDEKLFKKNHLFQTKDLHSLMDLYKIHRQRLYKLESKRLLGKKENGSKEKWSLVRESLEISFYDYITSENEDEYSVEFEFHFNQGKLDKKKLVSLKMERTKDEAESVSEMWSIEQNIFDAYRTTSISYKLYAWLESRLQRMTNWARRKHSIPLCIRKEAYEKSGRMESDPDCLKNYLEN